MTWSLEIAKVWGNTPYTIPRYFFTWKLWVIQKVMVSNESLPGQLEFLQSSLVCLTVGSAQIGNWNTDWQVRLSPGVSRVCSSFKVGNSGVCLTVCGNQTREDPHLKMCYVSLLEGFFLVFFLATDIWSMQIFLSVGKLPRRRHVESPKTEPGFDVVNGTRLWCWKLSRLGFHERFFMFWFLEKY